MSRYYKTKLGIIFICLLTFLNVKGQISINLNYEIYNQSETLYDGFGAGRKVLNEKRYSLIVNKQFKERLNLGIGYSFNRGIIYPHLTAVDLTPQNFKTYHRLNIYGDFDFLTGKFKPFIFNNTGLIFDYPKELSSYNRTNEVSVNSQIGLGVKWEFHEKWNLRVQYSIGQILGLKSHEIFQTIDLFGLGVGYRISDTSKKSESSEE